MKPFATCLTKHRWSFNLSLQCPDFIRVHKFKFINREDDFKKQLTCQQLDTQTLGVDPCIHRHAPFCLKPVRISAVVVYCPHRLMEQIKLSIYDAGWQMTREHSFHKSSRSCNFNIRSPHCRQTLSLGTSTSLIYEWWIQSEWSGALAGRSLRFMSNLKET